MVSVAAGLGNQSQLDAAVRVGIDGIDRNQSVTFTQYTKFTQPIDGSVFWIASANTFVVRGSLHYATDRVQDEDQTIAVNQMIFTAEQEVTEFNVDAPTTMWVGAWLVADGTVGLQVVFSRRGPYYQQADAWHYVGDAVLPPMAAQLLASVNDLPTSPIVSNSLPIWLTQNSFAPVYPSYLVPDNVKPPYIVAHIEPQETTALQAFPVFIWPGVTESGSTPLHQLPSSQLMKDRVRLTLYGFNNQKAIQYLVGLEQYSLDTDDFGFMNSPAIQDDKRTQVEIATIAQKKTIEIMASYYSGTTDAIAQRLIYSAALASVTVS